MTNNVQLNDLKRRINDLISASKENRKVYDELCEENIARKRTHIANKYEVKSLSETEKIKTLELVLEMIDSY